MKKRGFIIYICVFVLITNQFLGCSSVLGSNGGVKISSTGDNENDNLVFNVYFENFYSLPDKVDIYLENNEKPYLTDISVQNGKISFSKPKIYSNNFYVKANGIESNHIEIDFVYSVDVDNLSVFINSVPENEIVKLQVTGLYNYFINQIELFRNEYKKIELDLSRLEKPVLQLKNFCFENCLSLRKVVLPHGITSIGICCFRDCSNLQAVEIPDSVTAIYNKAFYNCVNLTSIKLPFSLNSIGESVFYNCSYLETINIPFNVGSIGGYSFSSCENLNYVYFESTENWIVGIFDGFNTNWENIDCTELLDPVNAAVLLQKTYSNGTWKKE